MNKLSGFLYTGTQIGKIERRAAAIAGLDSWTLMQRAGRCAFQLLQAKWPEARSLTVWCGAGNNTPSELQLELIRTLKPTVWAGMASYDLQLAQHAERIGFDHANC